MKKLALEQSTHLSVVAFQFDLLPHVFGCVCPLHCLQIQVTPAILLFDGGVSAVGQRAAASVTKSCDVILVSAKVLCLGLCLEAAVMVVDDLPYDLIVLHAAGGASKVMRLGKNVLGCRDCTKDCSC